MNAVETYLRFKPRYYFLNHSLILNLKIKRKAVFIKQKTYDFFFSVHVCNEYLFTFSTKQSLCNNCSTFTLLTTVLTFIVPNFDSDARLQRVPTYLSTSKAFPTRIIYHSSSTFILQKIVFSYS
jgi:hypothetical protein